MKELKEMESIEIAEYGIAVKPYLTLAQIQTITNEMMKYDQWMLREECLEYMVLSFCTDIKREELDNMNPSLILTSGLWAAVSPCIENLYMVHAALKYHESIETAVKTVAERMPDILKAAQDGKVLGISDAAKVRK